MTGYVTLARQSPHNIAHYFVIDETKRKEIQNVYPLSNVLVYFHGEEVELCCIVLVERSHGNATGFL
jgi:hypothetical protein